MTILYSPGTCVTQVCNSVDQKGPTQSYGGVVYLSSSPEWLEQPWNGRFEKPSQILTNSFPTILYSSGMLSAWLYKS